MTPAESVQGVTEIGEMIASSSSCTTQIDAVSKEQWSEILSMFRDATIYQTWSYGSFRWGERNLSHAILKRDGDVIAAAQIRIVRLPIVGAGIANVKWGPLWRRGQERDDPEIFREMLSALRNEYMIKRGLLLRIVPNQVGENTEGMRSMLMDEGFGPESSAVPYNTLVMDLSPSLDELRLGLRKKWRQHLGHAERQGLIIREGTSDDLFKIVVGLYKEMLDRKGFTNFLSIDDLRAVQKDLDDRFKMKIMVCECDGEPVAARVVSLVRDVAVDLIATTGNRGLDVKASYVILWRVVEWLKSAGCRWYDLGGIDPEGNPGVYQFKAGLAGKNGREISFEEFEQSNSLLSSSVVRMGDRLRTLLRMRRGSLKRNP